MPSKILRTLTLALVGVALLAAAGGAGAQTALTTDVFIDDLKDNLAAKDGSGEFVPLTDPAVGQLFTEVLDALLAGDLVTAQNRLDDLAALHAVRYELIEIVDAPGDMDVFGFRETEDHATGADFRGWGTALVRVGGATDVVYTAPHPIDDEFSETITVDAFLEDCCVAYALFSGARRSANGDGDGDGEPDADVAHETENLFHVLTRHVANLTAVDPAFHVQVHASIDRSTEPHIVASDGADPADTDSTHPLVAIDDDVDADGFLTMGVEGWNEMTGDEDGDYVNPGTTNVQGDFLETVNQRRSFMHVELERTPRDEYMAGSGDGFDGIRGMFASLREDLGPDLRVETLSAPASACAGEDIATATTLVVRNAGDGAVPRSSFVGWYLSDDPVLGAGDRLLLGGRDTLGALGPGDSQMVSLGVLELQSDVQVGSYYLLAVLDEGGVIDERIEGNNLAAVPLEVDCRILADFQGSSDGWSNAPSSTCTTGSFVVGTPDEVVYQGVKTQLSGDHSPQVYDAAFYTRPNTFGVGLDDVDGGVCIAESPVYTMEFDADLSLWYYHGQLRHGDDPSGDYFRIEASVDGGPYASLVSIGDVTTDAAWTEVSLPVDAGQTVHLRVHAADGTFHGDVLEAGLDDVVATVR